MNTNRTEFYDCLSKGEKAFFDFCLQNPESAEKKLRDAFSALRTLYDNITAKCRRATADYLAETEKLQLAIKEFSDSLEKLGKGATWAYSPTENDKKTLLKRYYAHIGKVGECISRAAVFVSEICDACDDIPRIEAGRSDAERNILIYSEARHSENMSVTEELPPHFDEKAGGAISALAAENEKAAGRYVSALEKAFDAPKKEKNMNIGLAKKACLAACSEISAKAT